MKDKFYFLKIWQEKIHSNEWKITSKKKTSSLFKNKK